MNRRSQIRILFRIVLGVVVPALVLSSCSNTKYLQKGQALLVSNHLKVKGNLLPSEKEDIRNNLNSSAIILQQPNYKTLKIARAGLWLYNRYDSSRNSSKLLGWLINNSWLKPPVIFDSAMAKTTTDNMRDFLINQGYFYASATYDARIRSQRADITYNVNTGVNFLIDSILYDIPDSNARKIVIADAGNSLLQPQKPYKYDLMAEERDRIALLLNKNGYYKFSGDDIVFVVDTTSKSLFTPSINPFESIVNVFNAAKSKEKPTLDITVRLMPEDSLTFKQYRINNIYLYPDFPINGSSADTTFHEIKRKNFTILYHRYLFKPRVLSRALYFKPGDLYNEQYYRNTLAKLNSLGQWKFVTIQFRDVPGDSGLLDCHIFMIPEKKQEVGVSLEASTATDYNFGSGIGFTYQNRNVHKNANLLTLSLKSGIELDSNLRVSAQEFSGQVNLNFPRFLTPIRLRDVSKFANAKTNLSLGFDYINRLEYYKFQNYYASLGYTWNETKTKSWSVKPFALAYNKYSNFSDNFRTELDSNEFLRNSFQSVFLEGENISYIFNNQLDAAQKHYSYLRLDLDESGLLLKALDGAVKGISGQRNNFEKLTSLNYSQYVKLSAEYKHYLNRPHSSFVSRAFAGIAVPYGGSPVVPYIKQFFAGGPNSMRAWHLRTLGPGSYKYNTTSNYFFIDQTGEMKLEGNLEFRFDIFKLFGGASFLKGAVFTDIGNIWNIHNDANKPGSVFQASHLYQDIAVGSGFGLRLDFNYFLLRLDMSVPLKDPSISRHYGWMAYGFRPLNLHWLGDNLVFNFAVGYPF